MTVPRVDVGPADVRRGPPPLLSLGVLLGGCLGALSVMRGIFDPDYFWHLATGRLIVQTGRVPSADPFTFTWHGQPWIPDQWLSDVAMYALVGWLGANAGLLVFGLVAATAPVILGWGLARFGVGYRSIIAASLLISAVVLPQVTMRPQVLSLPLLAAVIAVLLAAGPQHPGRLLLLPPLFLVWANLHGLYVVGLGVGFAYLVATLAGRTPMRSAPLWVVGTGAVSLLASMLTPSGPGGILYSLSFANPADWGARNIAEWQSPNFHDPQFLPFLVLIVVLISLGNRGPGWIRFVAYVGLVIGLLGVRSIAVGALMAMPAIALGLDATFARRGSPRGSHGSRARRTLELALAVVGAVVVVGATLARAGATTEVSNDRFPVAGTAYLAEHHPTARVLTRYGWGGYVLNELYPLGGLVFADGRMHKYGGAVLDDYSTIVAADSGWERLVASYGVGALLLRVDTPLIRGPAQEAGWCEVYRDDLQVLLLRTCD
jgi:hypothetical protein